MHYCASGTGQVALSDLFTGFIPLWLDAGYRINPSVYLGAYFQYGPGLTKNCNPGYNCSGHDLIFGIDGRYHFLPGERMDPWVGVGFGYEILGTTSGTLGNASGDVTNKTLHELFTVGVRGTFVIQ